MPEFEINFIDQEGNIRSCIDRIIQDKSNPSSNYFSGGSQTQSAVDEEKQVSLTATNLLLFNELNKMKNSNEHHPFVGKQNEKKIELNLAPRGKSQISSISRDGSQISGTNSINKVVTTKVVNNLTTDIKSVTNDKTEKNEDEQKRESILDRIPSSKSFNDSASNASNISNQSSYNGEVTQYCIINPSSLQESSNISQTASSVYPPILVQENIIKEEDFDEMKFSGRPALSKKKTDSINDNDNDNYELINDEEINFDNYPLIGINPTPIISFGATNPEIDNKVNEESPKSQLNKQNKVSIGSKETPRFSKGSTNENSFGFKKGRSSQPLGSLSIISGEKEKNKDNEKQSKLKNTKSKVAPPLPLPKNSKDPYRLKPTLGQSRLSNRKLSTNISHTNLSNNFNNSTKNLKSKDDHIVQTQRNKLSGTNSRVSNQGKNSLKPKEEPITSSNVSYGIKSSEKIKDNVTKIFIYYALVLVFLRRDQDCLKFIQETSSFVDSQKNGIVRANFLKIQACIFYLEKKTERSVSLFEKASIEFVNIGCILGQAACSFALGCIKVNSEGCYAQAIKKFDTALNVYKQLNHKYGQYFCHTYLWKAYNKLRDQEKKKKHHLEAKKVLQDHKIELTKKKVMESNHKEGIFYLKWEGHPFSLFSEPCFVVNDKTKKHNYKINYDNPRKSIECSKTMRNSTEQNSKLVKNMEENHSAKEENLPRESVTRSKVSKVSKNVKKN